MNSLNYKIYPYYHLLFLWKPWWERKELGRSFRMR